MTSSSLDLVLEGGRVLDPETGLDAVADLGIHDGRVEDIDTVGGRLQAAQHVPATGLVVMPGIVDAHVHISAPFGRSEGLAMLARAGVTTCLDLAGDGEDLARGVRERGHGIAVGHLHPLIPGRNLSGTTPSRKELAAELHTGLERGALGVKLLGGHYPLAPEAIRATVELAQERGCHVAVHCGSTASGSDIRGLEEAVELIGTAPVQIAHVNSYCRGQVTGDAVEEALQAIRLLRDHDIPSESYLAPWNGTSGRCDAGVPVSHVTRTCLRLTGYGETEIGLTQAVEDGHAHVNVVRPSGTELRTGTSGVVALQAAAEPVVSFPVNPPEVTALLASARDEQRFVITALATDGGSIPRNTTVTQGLALVDYGHLSLMELAWKASTAPAQMLGLDGRGTLRPGSHADVTVVDPQRRCVTYTFVAGVPVYALGALTAEGGNVLTTDAGEAFVQDNGCVPEVVRHVA